MKLFEDYFSVEEKQELVDAIVEAESQTSGEIRVYFERHCEGDPYERGLLLFSKLKMHKTKLHNAVLFYIALTDHKFSVIADEGIHQKVPDGFWDEIVEKMKSKFVAESVIQGMKYGILAAGQQLSQYFPVSADNVNELPNEILFNDHEEE